MKYYISLKIICGDREDNDQIFFMQRLGLVLENQIAEFAENLKWIKLLHFFDLPQEWSDMILLVEGDGIEKKLRETLVVAELLTRRTTKKSSPKKVQITMFPINVLRLPPERYVTGHNSNNFGYVISEDKQTGTIVEHLFENDFNEVLEILAFENQVKQLWKE